METLIREAQNGSADAVAGILGELDGLIRARARRIDPYSAEDLAQVGREALWCCLSRYDGRYASSFIAYADRTVKGAMMDAHCAMRYPGISLESAKLWRSALKHADGDADEAERLMCSGELAWRAKPETAKAVRSAVSPAEPLPEHLAAQIPAKPSEAVRERTEGRVAWMLLTLGEQQRAVLEMTFGLGKFGRMTDSEIGEALGIPAKRIPSVRSKALARLRARW
ncbi:sigma-70 family RNA polymerase sigma factor [Streptomyces hygroscopicus]|uniref:sigma-70 family RNA polymerase sigma factor n=1 Tax=Streptomyces hygroscopicus TaxID=1912 RepID=UPI0004C74A81|nr:sigma-70 family RNA polymerase sigma factor [Streptomyces hygroscopicus]